MRRNTYDAASGRITVDPVRADAFEHLVAYYSDVFGKGRTEYAIQKGALSDADESTRDDRLLLVDVVGGEHESSGQDVTLHTELAA